MAKTLGEQLIDVQNAIVKAESMQEYTKSDITIKRANLATLYKREERLLQKIAQYGSDYNEASATITARRAHVIFS